MTRRVAIVGVGQTRHAEFRDDRVYWENDYEAAKLALEVAALDKGQIDTVISSGWDAVDGRTISDMHTCMGIGGYLKDSAHVGEDGILALAYAYVRIASGQFDTAVVSGHGHREASLEAMSRVVYDPLFTRPVGANYLASLAMQANAYAQRHGVGQESAAKVVVKNRANGVHNPYAHLKAPVTLEDVLGSGWVAYPLRTLDCPPESVGGVALVLAAEEHVKRITDKPVWVKGIGWAIEGYYLGSKDLSEMPSCGRRAARLRHGGHQAAAGGAGRGGDRRAHLLPRAHGLRGAWPSCGRSRRAPDRRRRYRAWGQAAGEHVRRRPLHKLAGRLGPGAGCRGHPSAPRRGPRSTGRRRQAGPGSRLQLTYWGSLADQLRRCLGEGVSHG